MNGELVVSLIVGLRSVSLDVGDPAIQKSGNPGHDFGLRVPFASLDTGEVGVVDVGGSSESAQAVAALFALPSDFWSIGLHRTNVPHDTQRHNT